MKKHHEYSLLGFQALKRAAVQAAREAQMNNYKVPYWVNGKISVEIPELITGQSAPPDRDSAALDFESIKDNNRLKY
nr:hypothetical protein [Desulfobacula sp.]